MNTFFQTKLYHPDSKTAEIYKKSMIIDGHEIPLTLIHYQRFDVNNTETLMYIRNVDGFIITFDVNKDELMAEFNQLR